MTRLLSILPLAIVLTAGFPTLGRADDMADECRKLAAEEEVASEDMDDYIAECLAVIQSDTPEDLEQLAEPVPGDEGEGAAEPAEQATPKERAPDLAKPTSSVKQ